MPCYDHPDHFRHGETKPKIHGLEIREIAALACVLLDELGPDRVNKMIFNQKEAGITKMELLAWAADHKEADRVRKLAESEAARQRQIRADAIAKLTAEERLALGIRNS